MTLRRCRFCLMAALFMTSSAQAVEWIAHRGASYEAPENTQAAFDLGWQEGAEGVELDIQFTQDGKVAVIHDKTTERTAGAEGKVAEMTLEELRRLEYGAWKGEKWKGEPMPLLEDVLASIPEGRRLVIEIKCGPEVLPELERLLAAAGDKASQVVFISFGHDTVTEAKARFPEREVYWLASPEKESDGKRPTVEELIAKAQAAKVDGLNLSRNFAIDTAFVQAVHDAGLKLYVWTVNDPAQAKALLEAGIDGITTDRPAWLREAVTK